jgi:ligand-binding sensor domain-containing protein
MAPFQYFLFGKLTILIRYFYTMKQLCFCLFSWILYLQVSAQGLPPIGQWREHVPFNNAFYVYNQQNLIVGATPFGFFTYNQASKEFQRKTKMNGLSDVGLKLMSNDPLSKKMLVVYENNNIDIINGDVVSNIPDVLLKNTQSDKTINNACWIGNDVFLSANLGIIAVNTEKKEIRDTYKTGLNGSDENIFQVALQNNVLYAATASGLKKAAFNPVTLSDFNAWILESGQALLPGKCDAVLDWNGKLIVKKQDSVFIKNNGNWELFYASKYPVSSINIINNKLLLGYSINSSGVVLVFSSQSSIPQTFSNPLISYPLSCSIVDETIWVADKNNGLIRINGTAAESIKPNAPDGIALGGAIYADGNILASAGTINQFWQPQQNRNGFFKFDGNSWKSYNKNSFSTLDTIMDFISIAADPASGNIYAGSFGNGLVELSGEKINILNQKNFLSPSLQNPVRYNVSGLAVDVKQNLWISNYGTNQNLVVRKKDGTWKKFSIPFPHQDNAVGKILVDDASRKWIISPNGNGLFCFDDAETIDQTNDDQWRYFKQGRGNGNLPSSHVLSIVEDRNGFIWVGTDKGIGIIECGDDVFSTSACDATLPVVQQDNFAGLLFGDESVYDIAVDGANRKWVATNNGAWLISADGQKVISRFTQANSPLLSNKIHQIVVHEKTGEVFFFTQNGICSFRGTAVEHVSQKQKLVVFPNPVPPNFNGTIAIKNLPENAWVKITELDGKLVYQARSLGGQAIWNGRTYKGEKPSSNVFLVLVSNENNTMQLSTKIFFIK